MLHKEYEIVSFNDIPGEVILTYIVPAIDKFIDLSVLYQINKKLNQVMKENPIFYQVKAHFMNESFKIITERFDIIQMQLKDNESKQQAKIDSLMSYLKIYEYGENLSEQVRQFSMQDMWINYIAIPVGIYSVITTIENYFFSPLFSLKDCIQEAACVVEGLKSVVSVVTCHDMFFYIASQSHGFFQEKSEKIRTEIKKNKDALLDARNTIIINKSCFRT